MAREGRKTPRQMMIMESNRAGQPGTAPNLHSAPPPPRAADPPRHVLRCGPAATDTTPCCVCVRLCAQAATAAHPGVAARARGRAPGAAAAVAATRAATAARAPAIVVTTAVAAVAGTRGALAARARAIAVTTAGSGTGVARARSAAQASDMPWAGDGWLGKRWGQGCCLRALTAQGGRLWCRRDDRRDRDRSPPRRRSPTPPRRDRSPDRRDRSRERERERSRDRDGDRARERSPAKGEPLDWPRFPAPSLRSFDCAPAPQLAPASCKPGLACSSLHRRCAAGGDPDAEPREGGERERVRERDVAVEEGEAASPR
jgi:hypothetical protein